MPARSGVKGIGGRLKHDTLKDVFGYSAAVCGALLMLPQVAKMYATQSAGDVSAVTVVLYAVNSLLWFVYGKLIASRPVMATNAVCILIGIAQIFLKFHYSP